MSGSRTAAVVITWNRKDLLRQNLECLLGQEGAECDILLVDNASTDGTAEMVESDFADPRTRYLNTGSNLGGTGGFSAGIEWAAREGYDNIWIMDDDCLPTPTALAKLLEADDLLDGSWGWLCSAVLWTDGSVCTFSRPKKNVFQHISPEDYERGIVPAMMTSFVSKMLKGDAARELGLPVAEYFIWTDECEFTGRISKRYLCYADMGSRVFHVMKTNARPSLAIIDESGTERFYYLSRNDIHCYRQHGVRPRISCGEGSLHGRRRAQERCGGAGSSASPRSRATTATPSRSARRSGPSCLGTRRIGVR